MVITLTHIYTSDKNIFTYGYNGYYNTVSYFKTKLCFILIVCYNYNTVKDFLFQSKLNILFVYNIIDLARFCFNVTYYNLAILFYLIMIIDYNLLP